MLHEYIEKVRSGLQIFDDYGLAEQIDFTAEIRPGSQAILKAAVILIDTSELYIRDFLIARGNIQHLSYAYQYQKRDGALIFRYDNAKHRPPLGFNEHRHDASGDIIPADPPAINSLVMEIIDTATR
ncbi:MAG: hypothetical protein HC812_11325 [Leptolyngbya sp. RL_3_1]|nr:hypothetical protein [Leptolyngbya sp. RL_3_1]